MVVWAANYYYYYYNSGSALFQKVLELNGERHKKDPKKVDSNKNGTANLHQHSQHGEESLSLFCVLFVTMSRLDFCLATVDCFDEQYRRCLWLDTGELYGFLTKATLFPTDSHF